MLLNPQTISQETLISIILRDLQLEMDEYDERIVETIIAEYFRYIISISGAQGEPIHINRIMSRIRSQIGLLLPEDSDEWQSIKKIAQESQEDINDPVASILPKLLIIRDVEHVGNGFYVPTPFRVVELPHNGAFVVGGIPTKEVIQLLGKSVRSVGIIRFIKLEEKILDYVMKQSFEAWMGYDPEPVQDWLMKYLEKATKKLVPSSVSTLMSFEVYDPLATSTNLQYYRWNDCQNWSETEQKLYLCRTKMNPRRYWLGLLKKRGNEVQAIKEVDVPFTDVRRLQYGFDCLTKKPTFAQFTQSDKDIAINIFNYLPEQENRFFVGLLSAPGSSGRLPLKYRFPKDFLADVVYLLSNLGIKLRRI